MPLAASLLKNRRAALWDGLLVAVGVLFIGFTFHAYRSFEPSSQPGGARLSISASEADGRIASAKAYLTSHPDSFQAWSELAVASYEKGPDHYVDAMNALNKARDLGATDDRLFYYAGVMYDALGLPDYAIHELERYLRHDPANYDAQLRLANVWFKQKNYDQAQVLYRQALKYWPRDPTVWFNAAIVNEQKGDLKEAERDLDETQKLAGHLPPGGYFAEGELSRLKGDENAAIAAYQQEISAHPEYLPALEALETAWKRKNDFRQAREIHKQIMDLKRIAPLPAHG